MSQSEPAVKTGSFENQEPIVNDFCITFSTINGSGSGTANTTLLRALFKMGIPISGKNIFPSNIQGLPTWFSIRVSKEGFLGRLEKDDIIVAMNPSTLEKDIQSLVPGGVLFYADDIRAEITREDITVYSMPVKKLMKAAEVPPKLRDYIANMVYVGIVAQMLGIELDKIYSALDFHFKSKQAAINSNFDVIKAAAEWAAENLEKRDPYRVAPMNATDGCILTDGNTAAAIGAVYGGVQFAAWYPITPASSLAESMLEYLPLLRRNPDTGKSTYAVVQSEDELAAIGMATGAGWAGLRAMTSTSGPGLSLMAEYLGLAYYAEVPVVVWDVQRVGPSTGLPTRTAQCDLTFVNFIGHGDTHMVVLAPGSINECFEFGWRALDYAERLQTPVIVLSDLDLGMNLWMGEPFQYPDQPMDRGKILWEDELEKMVERGKEKWGRYLDVDGDGIPYRTVPGNQHPMSAYFARGTGHDEYGNYSEEPDVWERNLARIKRKFETARDLLPKPVIHIMEEAEIGIIAFGSTEAAIEEARVYLADKGILTDFMRVRAIPFSAEVNDFIDEHDRNYVVELNEDGQLRQLLILDAPQYANRLEQVAHIDGMPLSASWLQEQILQREAK